MTFVFPDSGVRTRYGWDNSERENRWSKRKYRIQERENRWSKRKYRIQRRKWRNKRLAQAQESVERARLHAEIQQLGPRQFYTVAEKAALKLNRMARRVREAFSTKQSNTKRRRR